MNPFFNPHNKHHHDTHHKHNDDIHSKHIVTCTNCNRVGHNKMQCKEPIVSYGVLLVNFPNLKKKKIIQIKAYIENVMNEKHISTLHEFNNLHNGVLNDLPKHLQSINFLMIQRKHTLGIIEILNGRYDVTNVEQLYNLFRQMSHDELKMLQHHTFEELWNIILGYAITKPSDDTNAKMLPPHRRDDYEMAKNKFQRLSNAPDVLIHLDTYIAMTKPMYETPEWGFPKGRRSANETEIAAAVREFTEETDIKQDEYIMLEQVKPLEEIYHGTDGKLYKTIYFIALANLPNISLHSTNEQKKEIGQIGLFNLNDCMKKIRNYHLKKKDIVLTLYQTFLAAHIKSN